MQAVAQASRDLAAQVDCITHTEQVTRSTACSHGAHMAQEQPALTGCVMQTIKQLSKKLDSLYASYSAALEGLQSVLPLQYTTEEICTQLEQQQEGTQMNVIEHSKT